MPDWPKPLQDILAQFGISQESVHTFRFGGIVGKVALVALGGFAAVIGVAKYTSGLAADDMKKCVRVRPEVVARIEFLEWTDGNHLRHAKCSGLHDDKNARSVTKEHAGEA